MERHNRSNLLTPCIWMCALHKGLLHLTTAHPSLLLRLRYPKAEGDDADAAHVAWVKSCAAALEPHTVGLYVNEVMHDEPGQVRRSYEEATYERLLELKHRVDPKGLLRAL